MTNLQNVLFLFFMILVLVSSENVPSKRLHMPFPLASTPIFPWHQLPEPKARAILVGSTLTRKQNNRLKAILENVYDTHSGTTKRQKVIHKKLHTRFPEYTNTVVINKPLQCSKNLATFSVLEYNNNNNNNNSPPDLVSVCFNW